MILPQALYDRMIQQALSEYPQESCGALLGNGDCILDIAPLKNMHEKPETGYRTSDMEVVGTPLRGLDLVGWYHSHCDAPADFSPDDIRQSIPGYRYVVLSVSGGCCNDVRCYWPNGQQTLARRVDLRLTK
jgi:proteasome lid subunit RPN8/RPN11